MTKFRTRKPSRLSWLIADILLVLGMVAVGIAVGLWISPWA